MSWLQRIFGEEPPEDPQAAISAPETMPTAAEEEAIPAERVGLNGEYDQSGLAKRVVLAFDRYPDLNDDGRLWVAQTDSTVVLKGAVSSQEILNKMIDVARKVSGATDVDVSQVTVDSILFG
jgi:hypothetical protein